MDVSKKTAIGDALKGAIDSIFGGTSAPATSATPTAAVPGITLRYGTLSHRVAMSDVNGRSIGDLFEDNSSVLGGVVVGSNTSIRDTDPTAGGVVAADFNPVEGRTYVASIRKEDKGC